MTKLSQHACEACRSDAPKVTGQEKQELLSVIRSGGTATAKAAE